MGPDGDTGGDVHPAVAIEVTHSERLGRDQRDLVAGREVGVSVAEVHVDAATAVAEVRRGEIQVAVVIEIGHRHLTRQLSREIEVDARLELQVLRQGCSWEGEEHGREQNGCVHGVQVAGGSARQQYAEVRT